MNGMMNKGEEWSLRQVKGHSFFVVLCWVIDFWLCQVNHGWGRRRLNHLIFDSKRWKFVMKIETFISTSLTTMTLSSYTTAILPALASAGNQQRLPQFPLLESLGDSLCACELCLRIEAVLWKLVWDWIGSRIRRNNKRLITALWIGWDLGGQAQALTQPHRQAEHFLNPINSDFAFTALSIGTQPLTQPLSRPC